MRLNWWFIILIILQNKRKKINEYKNYLGLPETGVCSIRFSAGPPDRVAGGPIG